MGTTASKPRNADPTPKAVNKHKMAAHADIAKGLRATTRQLVSTAYHSVRVGWSINKGMVITVEANIGAAIKALITTHTSNKPN